MSLSLVFLAATLLAYAPDDVPLLDDWTYAWSVRHFQNTGALRMLDWSAHYPLAQIVWAGGFTQVFGFSFAVLRLSTLLLGWFGLIAFYLTLRALGSAPFLSALGTLALLFNPVFFVLGHSFMTDIPFVSTMNIALLGYVLWVQRQHAGWPWCGVFLPLSPF